MQAELPRREVASGTKNFGTTVDLTQLLNVFSMTDGMIDHDTIRFKIITPPPRKRVALREYAAGLTAADATKAASAKHIPDCFQLKNKHCWRSAL